MGALKPCAAMAVALLVPVAGCGEKKLDNEEVERNITAAAKPQAGIDAQSTDCPDELAAKVGAKTECSVTIRGGATTTATATVTEVEDDTARYDVLFGDVRRPPPTPREKKPESY